MRGPYLPKLKMIIMQKRGNNILIESNKNMIDSRKAVFLPVDNKILNLFKGYILNGEPLIDVKESDVYSITKYYEFPFSISQNERIIRIIVMVPLVPLFIIILLVAAIFKRFDQASDKINYMLDSFFSIFFKKKKELRTRRIKKKKYHDAIEENIPGFLNHCKENFAKVYLYSYQNLKNEEKLKVEDLIASGFISSCQIITKLSDLVPFIQNENISVPNSLLIIKQPAEKNEASILGFLSENNQNSYDNGLKRNVLLWKRRIFSSEAGHSEIELNSNETIISIKREINYYLRARTNSFFTNDTILFIEDKQDEFLNNYIQNNFSRVSNRLEEKGMRLIYFPFFQNEGIKLEEPILEFIRYRVPILYSLSDSELNEIILAILQKLTPEEFYRMVLEELELPFFKRPCFLRNISGGFENTKNLFTYTHIEYQTEEELDKLFDWYIQQVKIPNDSEGIMYSKRAPPSEYDADWYFGKESQKDTDDLKKKIDLIKKEGKYGVMVEAIMYMLATIKEEKPEIINKVRPLLEKNKLLELKVILSPILVDKHFNIFLPDFGNIEVKMHALPKTVYILFLRYPKGIRFKELYRYKTELLEIYNKVTNKYEKEEIERAITDLVDMTKPNINMQCSRIRASFRNLMDEHIAKHYYIDGLNGEAKMISLPNKLIDIRY